MWLPARGRLFCVPVPAVINYLRPLSDPLALPHIFILTSFVIGLISSRTPLVLISCSVLWHRAPRCVVRGGNLIADLAYGNHPVVATHAVGVHQTISADVVHGCALVFKLGSASGIPGFRVSPLAVVLEPTFRIIHDLTFARAGDHSSVNDDTDFSSAPSCELGLMLRDVLLRLLFLRKLRGPTARTVLCRVDVKDAYRQVLVDPVGMPVFGYAVGVYVVVDLRLHFGWRNSPGFSELMASALDHSHNNARFQDAAVSPQGAAAVENFRFAPPQRVRVRPSPAIVGLFPVAAATPGVEWYYVDDGILSRVSGGRTVIAVCGLCSHWRRTTFVCRAYVARPTLLCCPPAKSLTGTRVSKCWACCWTQRRLR